MLVFMSGFGATTAATRPTAREPATVKSTAQLILRQFHQAKK